MTQKVKALQTRRFEKVHGTEADSGTVEIPRTVKIAGKTVLVLVDNDRVTVGESSAIMLGATRERISSLPYAEHFRPWQREMLKVFRQALAAERARIKALLKPCRRNETRSVEAHLHRARFKR